MKHYKNEKHYFDPVYEKYRITVCPYCEHFLYRASTNEFETYFKFLDSLPYRHTPEEAQEDLDKIAKENNWKVDERKRNY